MHRALIVVDVQKDFCEGGSVAVKGGAERAAAIAAMVNRARGARYMHVVATRDHHINPGGHFSEHPDYRDSFPKHCVAGSAGSEFHPAFQPAIASGAVDEIFYKGSHSAAKSGFEGAAVDGTTLADWLNAHHVDRIDIVGIATDHCVKATALDGARADFTTRVLLDYTAGVAVDSTKAALEEMRDAGIELTGKPVVLA